MLPPPSPPTSPLPPPADGAACFALFDDHGADAASPRSRLYSGYQATLTCDDEAALPDLLARMQTAQQQGLHAVALWQYELGARLQQITPHDAPPANEKTPLAEILLFSQCQHLSAAEVDAWLQTCQAQNEAPAGIANVRASVDAARFHTDIERIRAYIAAGDTYQVNYTYRLHFDTYGSPIALYQRLRARQSVPYGALVCLPDQRSVLSFSPELFVRHQQGLLQAQPMKGTAPALADDSPDSSIENRRRADALAQDEKNRAENLMIVDLLRNDLGRIAVNGSVTVPHLFAVDRFGQVLQMTSTVNARLRPDATLADIVTALYPCGSITGAPKRRTMQIIRELESSPRGLYTGAIGWFEAAPAGRTVGDFCLSVPIRTLVLQAPQEGVRVGEMGVGAGIVHDSRAAEEYAECQLKARFLTGLAAPFSLFETIHATRDEGCRHLHLHLQRLQRSAAYFNFVFDDIAVRAALGQACAQLPPATPHRVRLALDQDGALQITSAALTALPARVKVFIAPVAVAREDVFLRHKSTLRATYDNAWQAAERNGGFDMLFFNEGGELTEGGRSSVFVQLDGRWYTPPLAAGLLPGVMRSVLLQDPAWAATERRIIRNDLHRATAVVLCNALRGAVPADIVWPSA